MNTTYRLISCFVYLCFEVTGILVLAKNSVNHNKCFHRVEMVKFVLKEKKLGLMITFYQKSHGLLQNV